MKDATSRVSPKEEVPKAGKEGPSTIFLLVNTEFTGTCPLKRS